MARAMGATAISRVIRSDSMRLEHLVEVEAPVQAHGGTGLGGGQQVEETEDVGRRGGDLEAILRSEAQGRAPMAGCRTGWSGACGGRPSASPSSPS